MENNRRIWQSVLLSALLLSACGGKEETVITQEKDTVNEAAQRMLEQVISLHEQGRHLEAHQWADSLRTTYPKAVEARRSLLALTPHIDRDIAQDSLQEMTALLTASRQQLQALQKEFYLEKAPKYQPVGYYMDPSQKPELTHRTCLRAQVDEQGEITLISVLHGVKVYHRALLLTADKREQNATHCFSFITTETEGHEEEASFKYGGKIIAFLRNISGPVTVLCKGPNSNYSYQLAPADRKALLHCLDLWDAYQEVHRLEKLTQHLSNQVRFYTMKIEKHGY